MRIKRCFFVALLAVSAATISISVDAKSKWPPAEIGHPQQNQEHPRAIEDKGDEQSPSGKSVSSAEQHSKNADQNQAAKSEAKKEAKEKLFGVSPEGWTAIFTAVLAVFTIILAASTIGLYCAGERQLKITRRIAAKQSLQTRKSLAIAKESADVAKMSADALMATERGILIETVTPFAIDKVVGFAGMFDNSPSMGPSTVILNATIYFKNYGKTPVTIFEIYSDIIFSSNEPESLGAAGLIDRAIGEYTISPQAKTDEIRIERRQEISSAQSSELSRGTAHIWLIGAIRFVDVFDETCLRQFVWKYSRQTNGFKLHRSAEHRHR